MSQTIKASKKSTNAISSPTTVEFSDQKKISLDDKSKKKCIQVNLTDQIIKRLISAQNDGIKLKVKFSDKMQYNVNDGNEPIELEKSDIDQQTKVIISKSDSMEVIGSVGIQVIDQPFPDPTTLKHKSKFHARKNIVKGKTDEKGITQIVTVVGSGNSIHNFASYNDEPGVPLRQRIIHLVASTELSTSDIAKKVCENKDAVEKVLEEVANEHNKVWRLQSQSWLEVKPYEWTGYSSNRVIEDVASKMNKALDEMEYSPNHPQRPKPRPTSKPNIIGSKTCSRSTEILSTTSKSKSIEVSTRVGRPARGAKTVRGTTRGARSGRGGRGGKTITSSLNNDSAVNEKADSAAVVTITSRGGKSHSRGAKSTRGRHPRNLSTTTTSSINSSPASSSTTTEPSKKQKAKVIEQTNASDNSSTTTTTKTASATKAKRGRPVGSKNSRGGKTASSRSSINKSTDIKSTTSTATAITTAATTATTGINGGSSSRINPHNGNSGFNGTFNNDRLKIKSFDDYVKLLNEYKELYTEYDMLDQFLQKKEELHRKLSEDLEKSAGTKEEEKIAMKVIEEFGSETDTGTKLKSYSQLHSKLKIIKKELQRARSEGLNKQ
ncbi:6218_t:CDS:2 [Entrophospora sp. SA101]|nr:6218_t:CDS:2 [Entrophospora sp. SA101]